MKSPVRVLVRGPVLTSSGYGVHARQIARWILDRETDWNLDITFQALPWGITPWLINPESENGLIRKIMERTKEPSAKFDVSIQIQLPNEWDPSLAFYNIGITASVETDRCNPEWVTACNKMNGVVFPSEHARKSISNTGKIIVSNFVIPEAYGDAYRKNVDELPKLDLNFNTTFNFLMVGQLTGTNPECDRKNILNSLKWLCETFPDDDEVGIILKTNLGRHTAIDRHNITAVLSQIVREVRNSSLFPRFHLIHGLMSDEEMAAIYHHPSVKCFLAPTRGEGFGLPILEAAVCGLPIISTGWSGHTEFLSQGKSVILDYDLVDVHNSRVDGKIFVKGSRWARANEFDFKKKIKKFRNNSTIPRGWSQDLQISLKESHSQKAIEKKYDQLFEGVFKK